MPKEWIINQANMRKSRIGGSEKHPVDNRQTSFLIHIII